MKHFIERVFSVDEEGFFGTRSNRTAKLNVFVEMFGECEPTYQSLYTKALELNNGWCEIFDEWKEKGLIN